MWLDLKDKKGSGRILRFSLFINVYFFFRKSVQIKRKYTLHLMNTVKCGIVLLPFILLNSCDQNIVEENRNHALYPAPISKKVDITDGYKINLITGDSILPLINDNGDTLKTGVPIPVIGKSIHSDSVEQPTVVQITNPGNTINALFNVHILPEALTTTPVNQDSLTTIIIDELPKNDTTHYITSSTGDTIPTGVPIRSQGKTVYTTQSKHNTALPLKFKDAATIDIQYLDVDQGLASSYITDAYEDKKGNIWFGTYAGGISKYDGKFFSHFTKKEGLSANALNSIIEDKSGNMWFATSGGGVSRYDGYSFTHFTEKEGLSNNTVWAMLEDKNGNIWFGTGGGGVSMYDGESFTHFTTNEGLSSNIVMSISEDKNGNLWFGTWYGGVCKYDGNRVDAINNGTKMTERDQQDLKKLDGQLVKSFTHFTKKEGLSSNIVMSILEDKSGNLWFGTFGGGASRYDGKSFTHFTQKEGLVHNIVWSIREDKSGNLWFGTGGGGVSKYDGKVFRSITENEGLSNNNVKTIMVDKTGNLWFGTWGGGVNKYDDNSYMHITEKTGLSSNMVRSMVEDKNGNLWFGTGGGGVNKYDGKSFTHFTEKEGLSNNMVKSMLEDKNGNLWFGTGGGGVNKYDGKSFTQYTKKSGLSNDIILSILEDKNGNLWFGTGGGGVCMFDGKSFTHFTKKEGLSNNTVWSILEDKSGNLWFGTDGGGVCKFDGQSFTHFTEKEGLSNNTVWSMLEDKSGTLWFGTNGGGLNQYDGKSFLHITQKEGLSNNMVWSIQESKDGNIWASTESGLNELALIEDDSVVQLDSSEKIKYAIQPFMKNDGLKGLDFYINSVCLDSKNRMWWGSGKSLTMLDMNKHNVATAPPIVYLRQLDVNETVIDYSNISDSLSKKINFDGMKRFQKYPLNLELRHNLNHLTFHFAAIDWHAPHKIQYSYMIDGLNPIWSTLSTDGKAVYRNIPYGTYIFKVRAIGESGEWGELFEYNFKILPPWWHTWWARILYALTAMFIVMGIVKLRTRQLEKRQKKLKIQVEYATQEIRTQRDEISKKNEEKKIMLKEIHHRVKNNLQIVNSLLRLQSHEFEDKKVIGMFEEVQNRVISMAMLHEKMYKSEDFKHIDIQGHFNILVKELVNNYAVGKNINLDIAVDKVDIGIKTLVPLGLVINEIITNSLKYAFKDREKGEITLELNHLEGVKYELLIGDDGSGIPKGSEKSGLGLELISIFTEQLEGEITQVKSEGTKYQILFENIDSN